MTFPSHDRWPAADAAGVKDMKMPAERLEYLTDRLEQMATAPPDNITNAIDELFGERVGSEQRSILAKRYDRRAAATPVFATPRTGAIAAWRWWSRGSRLRRARSRATASTP